jgi:hypothetical protein
MAESRKEQGFFLGFTLLIQRDRGKKTFSVFYMSFMGASLF